MSGAWVWERRVAAIGVGSYGPPSKAKPVKTKALAEALNTENPPQ